jgi:hypothetical protein
MAEIAYDTINQPALDFFLRSQAFTSRIISLDRYHRQRGTPETELDTFQDAQLISADLNRLWAARPSTMAFLDNPGDLTEALQPRLARRVLLNLRVYTANFWAQFIYLHRVAFKPYPPTKDVNSAVMHILQCAREILCDDISTAHLPLHGTDGRPQFDRANSTLDAGVGVDTAPAYYNSQARPDTGLPATMR